MSKSDLVDRVSRGGKLAADAIERRWKLQDRINAAITKVMARPILLISLDRLRLDDAADLAALVEGMRDPAERIQELLEANNVLLDRARTAERQLALAPAPPWVADFLNRRTDVEKVLRDVFREKRVPLTREEYWELANRLSVPSSIAAAATAPSTKTSTQGD